MNEKLLPKTLVVHCKSGNRTILLDHETFMSIKNTKDIEDILRDDKRKPGEPRGVVLILPDRPRLGITKQNTELNQLLITDHNLKPIKGVKNCKRCNRQFPGDLAVQIVYCSTKCSKTKS